MAYYYYLLIIFVGCFSQSLMNERVTFQMALIPQMLCRLHAWTDIILGQNGGGHLSFVTYL